MKEGIFQIKPTIKTITKTVRISQKIHFAVKSGWDNTIVPYCRRDNTQFYSFSWKDVTCFYCKQDSDHRIKEILLYQEWRKQDRQRFKEECLKYGLVRKEGEKYREFKQRVDQQFNEEMRKERESEDRKHVQELHCTDFTTFPLTDKYLKFPLSIPDAYNEDDYEKIPQGKYIALLKEMQKLIETQLEVLGDEET